MFRRERSKRAQHACSPRKFFGHSLVRMHPIGACTAHSLVRMHPIGACAAHSWRNCAQPVRSTATFPHKKKTLSGLFPSTVFHRQIYIRNMLPHGRISSLIIPALNGVNNLPMQLNGHINHSGVLRQGFTHCQTNPVFKGIL